MQGGVFNPLIGDRMLDRRITGMGGRRMLEAGLEARLEIIVNVPAASGEESQHPRPLPFCTVDKELPQQVERGADELTS